MTLEKIVLELRTIMESSGKEKFTYERWQDELLALVWDIEDFLEEEPKQ